MIVLAAPDGGGGDGGGGGGPLEGGDLGAVAERLLVGDGVTAHAIRGGEEGEVVFCTGGVGTIEAVGGEGDGSGGVVADRLDRVEEGAGLLGG